MTGDQQWLIEQRFLRKLFPAEEELHVRILCNRLDRFAIGQALSFFDQQCAQRYASRNNRLSRILAQIGMLNLLGQFPRNQLGERQPAILRIQVAAEGKLKVWEFQLLTILAAVHPVTGGC